MIHTLLFDLDDTLYPRQAGVMSQIGNRILSYMRFRLDLSFQEANLLRRQYLQIYGTTMRGLQINHQIDPDEYLHYVHDIPLGDYLQPNPELDALLSAIPQRKVIFTNASREHAQGVLDTLGIRRHFERIVDIRDMDYQSKPQPHAYRRICDMLDVRPEECLIVEDNVSNLQPAKALGMTTVLVQDGSTKADDSVDHVLARIEDLGRILNQIDLTSGQ